jgi:hypothetical protein
MRSQVLFVLWCPGGFSPAVCSQPRIYTHSSGLSRRVGETLANRSADLRDVGVVSTVSIAVSR